MQAPRTQTPIQGPTQDDTHDGLLNILSDDSVQPHNHVIIIDSMTVVQYMKKRLRHEEDHKFQGCICEENNKDGETVR